MYIPENNTGKTYQFSRQVDGSLTGQRQTLASVCEHQSPYCSMSDIGFDGFDGFDGFSLEGYVRAREAEPHIFCPPLENLRQMRQTAIHHHAVRWFAFDVGASNRRQPAVNRGELYG